MKELWFVCTKLYCCEWIVFAQRKIFATLQENDGANKMQLKIVQITKVYIKSHHSNIIRNITVSHHNDIKWPADSQSVSLNFRLSQVRFQSLPLITKWNYTSRKSKNIYTCICMYTYTYLCQHYVLLYSLVTKIWHLKTIDKGFYNDSNVRCDFRTIMQMLHD